MKVVIEGMHCDACVRRVKKAIETVPAAEAERVEVGSAEVRADGPAMQAVLDAIRKAGYEPRADA